ncbi:MAG: clostripain-related cysteine peptidase [Methanobacteriota archaeon]
MKAAAILGLALLFTSLGCLPAGAQAARYDWVVAIYVSADNTLSDNVQQDLDEITSFVSQGSVDVFALVDQDGVGDSRLLEFGGDSWLDLGLAAINASWGPELDMGAPETLRDFVSWADSQQPECMHALDLWGHGAGWPGVCMDRGSWLTMPEIECALAGHEPDLLSIDACQMGMVEVAYQLRNSADVLVASEKDVPAEGWHYGYWLSSIQFAGVASLAGTLLAQTYMSWARNHSAYSTTVSVIDLKMMGSVAQSFSSFAHELRRSTSLLRNNITSARGTTERYDGDAEYDLAHLAQNIASKGGSRMLAGLTGDLEQAVYGSIVYSDAWTRLGDESAEHANGLSVWFPLNGATPSYRALALAADTGWAEFLDTYGTYAPAPHYRADLSIQREDTDGDGAMDAATLSVDTDAEGVAVFLIDGLPMDSEERTIASGHASASFTGLPFGTYPVSAYIYGKDGNLAAIAEPAEELVIEAWLHVNGTVTDKEGVPIDGAFVEVRWGDGGRANGTTGEAGRFEVKILCPTHFVNGTITASTVGAHPATADAGGPGELNMDLVVEDEKVGLWLPALGISAFGIYAALLAMLLCQTEKP